jgi:hypothetical protein
MNKWYHSKESQLHEKKEEEDNKLNIKGESKERELLNVYHYTPHFDFTLVNDDVWELNLEINYI